MMIEHFWKCKNFIKIRIGFNLSLAYKYLDKASVESNHLERLKLCVSFFITNLNHTLIGYKPFNPILGETYQAVIKSPDTKDIENKSNIKIYAEQTSHHPPILNFYGFSDSYKIKGFRETSAIASGNSVIANVQGPFNIEFKDANITAYFPPFSFFGLVYGKRMFGYNGIFKIEDTKNGLIAIIDINPKQQSKGFFGSIFGKKEKIFPDYFKGYIAKTTDVKYDQKKNIYNVDENKILSHIEGEYNNYVEIDGKNTWNIAEYPFADIYLQNYMLPSDSQFRSDLILYKNEKIEMAQYAKMNMEDLQRKDVKLRKKYQEIKEKNEKVKKK